MAIRGCFLVVLMLSILCVEAKYMAYNTTAGIVPGKINVHLVPHTHDDVGWLKTVDQYYVGSNNSIQAFFQRWWREQSEEVQSVVKALVSSGQLELINGGMCMHDEAAPHYIDMIDQTTLGHRFIKQEFNLTPRIGWQIDPFGHSAVQAYLLGAEVGFDSLFFARIDYQDRAKRKDEKTLEIFAGAFPKNYEPPSDNFYFEVDSQSPLVQDDMNLFDYNVPERVDEFVAAAIAQANITRTNHIMWTMGTDFQYQFARTWFRQMDKFINYVNQAARQLEFFKGRSNAGPNTDSLADAMAITQHHDSVSGTSKQHVADDYAKRLSIGYTECPLLNISYCPASEVDLSNGKSLVVVVYNSLGWKREDVIRIPDSEGSEIESQLLPLLNESIGLRNYYSKAYTGSSPSVTPKFWLAFPVSIPPLGFKTYIISRGSGTTKRAVVAAASASGRKNLYNVDASQNDTVEIGPGNLKLIYSAKEGKLVQYVNKRSSVKASVQQSYSYYAGNDGSVDQQASGAYIFRPNGTYPIKSEGQGPLTVILGPLLDEVHQKVNSWIYQVGPIPIDDGIGKEVVTKVTTAMQTDKTFFTDSSGRDFLKRIRDYRKDWNLQVNQPVAGNYYPIVGKYYLRIDPLNEGAKWRRSQGQEIYSPLLLAFLEQDGDSWTNSHGTTFTAMDPSYSLPDNVAIITLQELDDGNVILRLAHLFEIDEDKDLSVKASVELKKVFANKKINKVTETSLSANQERAEMERKRLVWKVDGATGQEPKVVRGAPVDPAGLAVELAPMEIRTFLKMGKENEAAAMEIDGPKSNSSDQINPRYSINALEVCSNAAWSAPRRLCTLPCRRYCTARLRRLHKSLKFTHGRGKYTRKAITESTVTEVRFLHLVLYAAERAWSHAMEKRQLPDGPNARQRIYLIGRLRKAVKWAVLFSRLCAAKGDSRTSLEAEAYASYMNGNLLFEQDRNWDVALKNFLSARAVYEELGKYGDLENQVLCRERVEELEPSIRYCRHKIGESNLQGSELLNIEVEGPALDLFKAKLEAALAEARSQQAASLTEFHWLGHKFPISNAKTRVAILKAQELEKDLHGPATDSLPAEKKLVIFDKIFTAYHEARSSIRSDLASAGNADGIKDDLNGLDKAVSAVLGQRTIDRNQLLVSTAKSKLTKRRDDKSEKGAKPEELVRLYDLLLQNTADLSDLVSSGRDRKPEEVAFAEDCERRSLAFRAQSLAGKRTEAYALYCRARSLAENALKKFQTVNDADQVMIEELKTLHNECRSSCCIEHATGIIEEEKVPENLSKKVSAITLDGGAKKVDKFLLEKLDDYESAVGEPNTRSLPRIQAFPPPFQTIARNPIVLDLAYDYIDFPSLENRMKKDKKGFISRLWRNSS
ncbi:hypothetical protein Tsubulata_017421, partial [Turnera subulata]